MVSLWGGHFFTSGFRLTPSYSGRCHDVHVVCGGGCHAGRCCYHRGQCYRVHRSSLLASPSRGPRAVERIQCVQRECRDWSRCGLSRGNPVPKSAFSRRFLEPRAHVPSGGLGTWLWAKHKQPCLPEEVIERGLWGLKGSRARIPTLAPVIDNGEFVGSHTVARSTGRLIVAADSASASKDNGKMASLSRLRLICDFTLRFLQDAKCTVGTRSANRPFMQVAHLQMAVSTAISINRALDAIGDAASDFDDWQAQLVNEVARQVAHLSRVLDEELAIRDDWSDKTWVKSELDSDRQRLQLALLMFYALRGEDYAAIEAYPAIRALIHRAFTIVTTRGDLIVPVAQPTWFDPCLLLHQRLCSDSDFSRGEQSSDWQIGFNDVGVSVVGHEYNSNASEEKCIRQAALWSGLLHPNVLALDTASYVGTSVLVYDNGVPLAEFF